MFLVDTWVPVALVRYEDIWPRIALSFPNRETYPFNFFSLKIYLFSWDMWSSRGLHSDFIQWYCLRAVFFNRNKTFLDMSVAIAIWVRICPFLRRFIAWLWLCAFKWYHAFCNKYLKLKVKIYNIISKERTTWFFSGSCYLQLRIMKQRECTDLMQVKVLFYKTLYTNFSTITRFPRMQI